MPRDSPREDRPSERASERKNERPARSILPTILLEETRQDDATRTADTLLVRVGVRVCPRVFVCVIYLL